VRDEHDEPNQDRQPVARFHGVSVTSSLYTRPEFVHGRREDDMPKFRKAVMFDNLDSRTVRSCERRLSEADPPPDLERLDRLIVWAIFCIESRELFSLTPTG